LSSLKTSLTYRNNADITGSQSARKAIIVVHDIFGPTSQALQGADRISQHFSGCLVILPDFFKGTALRHDQRSQIREFLAGPGAFSPNADALRLDIVPGVRKLFPQIEQTGLGVFGLCWGAKIAVLASNADAVGNSLSLFGATGQAHPAGLDVEDAKLLKTPHLCLASKDEDKDVVAGYAKALETNPGSVVETYATMFHGWMGARANLEDEENRAEYERGYRQAAEFFSKHL
jgi:dienelactone hydrolase